MRSTGAERAHRRSGAGVGKRERLAPNEPAARIASPGGPHATAIRWTGQRGSHRIFRHESKAGTVTVAGHPGEDVPPGTLASIRRQAGLSSEEMR